MYQQKCLTVISSLTEEVSVTAEMSTCSVGESGRVCSDP